MVGKKSLSRSKKIGVKLNENNEHVIMENPPENGELEID